MTVGFLRRRSLHGVTAKVIPVVSSSRLLIDFDKVKVKLVNVKPYVRIAYNLRSFLISNLDECARCTLAFALNMATLIFSETLKNFYSSTRPNPESRLNAEV